MNRKKGLISTLIVSFFILSGMFISYMAGLVESFSPLKDNIGKVCLDCHPELKKELASGKPHEPLRSEECIPCHSPHAARYKYLLSQTDDTLCYECHKSGRDWLKEKVIHLPLEYGECQKCHKPHVSIYRKLLRTEEKEICFQCHDSSPFQKKYVHQPVKEGRCTFCHEAHSSSNALLLTQSSHELCLKCHTLTKKLVSRHAPNILMERVDCLLCHSPHSSTRDNLIYSLLHDPYAKNNCKACHHETSGSIKPGTGDAKSCYVCHKESEEKFKSKMLNHIVSGPEECTFCHNPHGAEREDTVKRGDRYLCVPCHQDIGKRLRVIRKGLRRHPEVIEGRCSTCHDSHSSDDIRFLRGDPILLCIECHKRQSVACHPIGEKALDPRSKTPIDCLTCHNPMEAEFPMIMRLDGSKQLCNECHKY